MELDSQSSSASNSYWVGSVDKTHGLIKKLNKEMLGLRCSTLHKEVSESVYNQKYRHSQICIHIYAMHMCAHIGMYIYIYVPVFVEKRYIHIYLSIYLSVYIYICICMYIYIYMYDIYINERWTRRARPGQARPGQARPGQARPGQARPGRQASRARERWIDM